MSSSDGRISRGVRLVLDVLVLGLAARQVGMLLWVFWQRVGYPYDIEWMEGATLISALRVTQGLPLYGAAEPTYIPFIYPPLYAWVVAACSTVFPFGYALARSVSIAGTLAAAAALVFGGREAGARWSTAIAGAAIFLGTWEETGTFFDLVRIDGLSIGLIGWALVLAAGRTPARAIAGGAVLAIAFACKHHAAIFGFPVVLALWHRDGRAQALRFGLAAALPALLFVIGMQVGTGGRFLLWLVEVPSHHGIVASRFFPSVSVSSWSPLKYELTGAGMEVVKAMPLAWLVAIGIGLRARTDRAGLATSPRFVYWLGVSVVGLFVVSLMRGHVGGFTNVLIPMMWLQALWPSLASRRAGEGVGGMVLSALVAAQVWLGGSDYKREIPTEADRRQTAALVEEIRALPGPVLLPHAPYYAVLAGHEPSFALIALWDVSDDSVPRAAAPVAVTRALRSKHWASGVFPPAKPGSGVEKSYVRARALVHKGPPTLTGWRVKLADVWLPKDGESKPGDDKAGDDKAGDDIPDAPGNDKPGE